MDIVIISNYWHFEHEKSSSRYLSIANGLAKTGAQVEVITSTFYHALKRQRTATAQVYKDYLYKTTLLQEPGYSKNVDIKRFISHKLFANHVISYLESRKRPDIIYLFMPPIDLAYKVMKFAKKNHIRFIIDILDLWPEAYRVFLPCYPLTRYLLYPMKYQAEQVYAQADEIIAVSNTYLKRAQAAGSSSAKGHAVFIGTELTVFDENAAHTQPALIKTNPQEIWLGYCGSLSASYDIPCVLEALHILKKQEHVVPKFIVMGDGTYRKQFESLAKAKNLDVVFLGKLPYDQMCAQLKQCDIVVNPITKDSAASIINKHGDYAAAAIPVLNTQESPEYRALVDQYRMGLNCNNADPADLAGKLKYLLDDPALRQEMGKNARRCAEDKFDRNRTYAAIIRCITSEGNNL